MSGQACVLFLAVNVRVCTDGHQEGQNVYCFRPRGMPAVMDGLDRGFPQAGLCVSVCVSVRSLAAKSNHTLISLDQKQESHHGEFFLTTSA